MRRDAVDLRMYFQAFAVYANNLGVMLFPLIAALVGVGLDYFSAWLFAPIGGAGYPIIAFLIQMIYGFAFAIALIFADDAWRHGRGNLGRAWREATRKTGSILLAVLGFFFLVYVAQLAGSMLGSVAGEYVSKAFGVLAVWAFIYSIPAAALGGVPGGASFSSSVQAARRNPLATAVLTIVSIAVWYFVALELPVRIGPYLGAGYDMARVILAALALGYIALIVARQYSDLAFRPYL